MKNRLQGICIGLIIGILLSTAVLAAPISEWISVIYDDYKIVVNGTDKSSVSEDMKPFNYNGRTYISLRHAAQALGMDIEWEENTKTIYISDANSAEFVLSPSEPLSEEDLSTAASVIGMRLQNAGIHYGNISLFEGNIVLSVPKNVEKQDVENCIVKGYLNLKDSENQILLDKKHIQTAYACYDDLTNSGILQHYVEIQLTKEGQSILAAATKTIAEKADNQNYIAILVDDIVYSVPFVTEQIDADRIILSGYFTENSAKGLAAVLTSVELPCKFSIKDE